MANITKWIQKSKHNSLNPGEEVLSALGVAVQNKVKYMAAGVLGGILGELIAAQRLKKQENERLLQPTPSMAKYPRGAVIITLTQRRFLVYKLNILGRPKALGASYEKSEVTNAAAEKRLANYSLTLTFADGGSITHDVSLAQGSTLRQFVDLINKPQS